MDCDEGALVLELKSNHWRRVPKEKMGDVIRVIEEVFRLPDDAKPKWYLEVDSNLKDPDGHLLSSKSPFPRLDGERSDNHPILVSLFEWRWLLSRQIYSNILPYCLILTEGRA